MEQKLKKETSNLTKPKRKSVKFQEAMMTIAAKMQISWIQARHCNRKKPSIIFI